VRKIFNQRARIVVYLENEAIDRMLVKARDEGRTLVEWARETLLGELDGAGNHKAGMRGSGTTRPVRRGISSGKRVTAVFAAPDAEPDSGGYAVAGRADGVDNVRRKTCKHGIAKGWRCWQCGGIAVIE
jgi:hypothetical protein